MKNKMYCLMFLFIMVFTVCVYAEFAPWNADVKTGDDLHHFHDIKEKNNRLFNGAQCGAFFLVRFFQIVISPQDGPSCRHVPVCSVYARTAVIKHGAFTGSIMAGDRLLRCNPFYPPEKDPVPDKVFK